jgi:glycosyltransferase involved in cell wall biosynthesis
VANYTRLWEEVAILQEAGASVLLYTFAPQPVVPPGLDVLQVEHFLKPIPGPSRLSRAPLRLVDNAVRFLARRLVDLVRPDRDSAAPRALRKLAREGYLLWAIDFTTLPDAMKAAEGTNARVLYETFDLVPEYGVLTEAERNEFLETERQLIGRVDGFITVCDPYADYYMERYGGRELERRPVVRNDMPKTIVSRAKASGRPLRLLFLGNIAPDRPIAELIEAVALTDGDVALTFQGTNLLGDEPQRLIERFGVGDRVRVVPPCAPDEVVETAAEYDVGIVALRGTDENERRAETTKLYTSMSAGLVILASNLPGIARAVNRYQNGTLVDGASARAWADGMKRLATRSSEELDAMKRRSLTAANDHSIERQKPAFVAEFVRAMAQDKSARGGRRG